MCAWIPQEVFMTLQLSPRSKNTHQRPPPPPSERPGTPQKHAAGVVASQVAVGATEQGAASGPEIEEISEGPRSTFEKHARVSTEIAGISPPHSKLSLTTAPSQGGIFRFL